MKKTAQEISKNVLVKLAEREKIEPTLEHKIFANLFGPLGAGLAAPKGIGAGIGAIGHGYRG